MIKDIHFVEGYGVLHVVKDRETFDRLKTLNISIVLFDCIPKLREVGRNGIGYYTTRPIVEAGLPENLLSELLLIGLREETLIISKKEYLEDHSREPLTVRHEL